MADQRSLVAVFLGGPSSEHDISLKTGSLVLQRLDHERFSSAPVYVDRDRGWHFAMPPFADKSWEGARERGVVRLPGDRALPWRPDVAFIALHGSYGEDGQIQRELETLDVPYTGSGPEASRLALDKAAAKSVFRRRGLPVARDFELFAGERGSDAADRIARAHRGPWVVKPRQGGSSVGVRIASDGAMLASALCEALEEEPSIVEAFVAGRELTCGVLEHPGTGRLEALPVTEIVPKTSTFFDFSAKYTVGGSEEITPAKLSADQTERVKQVALAAHGALGCRGYSRSDFILGHEGLVLLELNTLPGLTETSLFPQEAAAVGISYTSLLTRLIDLAKH